LESEQLKIALAADAIIGAMASPSVPGTAYVLFHHVMGECSGGRGRGGYVRGGMGGITQALASAARAHGTEIRVNSPVAKIVTRRGRVKGVALEDGTEFQARKVVSNADAHVTFLQLLEQQELAPEFVAAVKSIDYASASLKINVALSELPDFTAVRGSGLPPNGHLRGTIHLAPTLDYIERAYDDAKYGRPSADPILECTIPSVVDTTVAPPGKGAVPRRLGDGARRRRHWRVRLQRRTRDPQGPLVHPLVGGRRQQSVQAQVDRHLAVVVCPVGHGDQPRHRLRDLTTAEEVDAVAQLRVLDLPQRGLAELERGLEAGHELVLGIRPGELVHVGLLHAARCAAALVVPFLDQVGDHVPVAHLGGRGLIAVLVGRHLLRGVHDVLRLALRHGPDTIGDRVLGGDQGGEGANRKQRDYERGSHARISCEVRVRGS